MITIKTLAKQLELANKAELLYVDGGKYAKATPEFVTAQHGKVRFYVKRSR